MRKKNELASNNAEAGMPVDIYIYGTKSSGKTSLVQRYIENKFEVNPSENIITFTTDRVFPVDYKGQAILLNVHEQNPSLNFTRWTVSERTYSYAWESHVRKLFKNAALNSVFIVCLDPACMESLYRTRAIMDLLHNNGLKVILVITKIDMPMRNERALDDYQQYVLEKGIPYFETSAQANIDIELVMETAFQTSLSTLNNYYNEVMDEFEQLNFKNAREYVKNDLKAKQIKVTCTPSEEHAYHYFLESLKKTPWYKKHSKNLDISTRPSNTQELLKLFKIKKPSYFYLELSFKPNLKLVSDITLPPVLMALMGSSRNNNNNNNKITITEVRDNKALGKKESIQLIKNDSGNTFFSSVNAVVEPLEIDNNNKFYLCPLSNKKFVEPVIFILDLRTYEKEEIIKWVRNEKTYPITGEALSNEIINDIEQKYLITNHSLRDLMERFSEDELEEISSGPSPI